jgi:alpha-beta hydrolase superfamily lysophospholipase
LVLNHVLIRGLGDLKGIISQAPLLRPYEPLPGGQMFALKILRHILPNFTADSGLDSGAISTMTDEVEKYKADPLVHGMMGAGLAVDVMRQGEWALSQADNWTAPLLLLHAREDKLTQFEASEDFAKRAQNCQFHAFDDAYHEIHNDTCRAHVYDLIATFIKSRL